jgi:hypothetical protein
MGVIGFMNKWNGNAISFIIKLVSVDLDIDNEDP